MYISHDDSSIHSHSLSSRLHYRGHNIVTRGWVTTQMKTQADSYNGKCESYQIRKLQVMKYNLTHKTNASVKLIRLLFKLCVVMCVRVRACVLTVQNSSQHLSALVPQSLRVIQMYIWTVIQVFVCDLYFFSWTPIKNVFTLQILKYAFHINQ
jgi:hypothetical protein